MHKKCPVCNKQTSLSHDMQCAGFDKPEPTIFETIADGLEAFIDGRGWDTSHEYAKNLANAAPKLLEALEAIVIDYDLQDTVVAKGSIDKANTAIALAKGDR